VYLAFSASKLPSAALYTLSHVTFCTTEIHTNDFGISAVATFVFVVPLVALWTSRITLLHIKQGKLALSPPRRHIGE
jgi:branched-subunit amino acid transport protein AzlD